MPHSLQLIATQMGRLVAERMSGAPSAVGDLCQLLTPELFSGRAAVDEVQRDLVRHAL